MVARRGSSSPAYNIAESMRPMRQTLWPTKYLAALWADLLKLSGSPRLPSK